jgi:hypothetical protein
MEEQIYTVLEKNGIPKQLYEQLSKDLIELINGRNGQIFIFDGINSQIEEVDSIEEAKNWIEENFIEDGEIHPDIESLFIARKIASVKVEEVEETEIDGEKVNYCKLLIE